MRIMSQWRRWLTEGSRELDSRGKGKHAGRNDLKTKTCITSLIFQFPVISMSFAAIIHFKNKNNKKVGCVVGENIKHT